MDLRSGWHALRDALEQGDPSTADELLQYDPSLIHATNGLGESVLHFLAVENNQPAVSWLREHGADLNVTNEFGIPMLFEVALLGYKDLFLWLVDHGADPTKKNADLQSISEYLLESGKLDMIAFIKENLTL